MESMRSTESINVEFQPSRPPADLQIISWPLRDDPVVSCTILVSGMAVIVVIAIAGKSLLIGLVGIVSFALAVWRMWLPIHIRHHCIRRCITLMLSRHW